MHQDQVLYNACLYLIGLFKDQIDTGYDCVHTRIFNYIVHPEIDYVFCGSSASIKPATPTHTEHIVPCKVLVEESFRLLKEGNHSNQEVAKLLKRHWKIVTISKDEALKLDSSLGLKSKMPYGWDFETGDTFERLKQAKISLVQK